MTTLPCSVLQRGLLATISDFCVALSQGRLLVEIQTVTTQWGFRKRASVPQLKHTASSLFPTWWVAWQTHWVLSLPRAGSPEFSAELGLSIAVERGLVSSTLSTQLLTFLPTFWYTWSTSVAEFPIHRETTVRCRARTFCGLGKRAGLPHLECTVTWSFYRSSPSSRLEEADPYTQIDLSHAHLGPVDAATKSEQCDSSRQVAQGRLYTMSNFDPYLNPTQVNPEPTQPVEGFRPNQWSTQLATPAAHPNGDISNTRPFWEQLHHGEQPLHSISYTVIKVYP